MKAVIPFLVLLAFSSCGGYFDQEQTGQDGKLQPLALADGSGFLSTDQYNEITPFVFRNPYSGKNYIFFSSDRSGNYDIYYSELLDDGTFIKPIKMSNDINTSSNEISPVLFYYNFFGNVQLFISYIQISPNLASTNIITWIIDSNSFTNRDYVQDSDFNTNATHIGYAEDPTNFLLGGNLIVSFGNSKIQLCNKGTVNTEFRWALLNQSEPRTNGKTMNLSKTAYAANGFYDPIFGSTHYIFQNSANQLWAGKVSLSNTVTNFFDLPLYASRYRDIDPFVDSGDPLWKVYFASDRNGKGNFDLYRYNYMTYRVVAP